MSTDNICLYKEVARKYTCCNLKTTELLNCALIGVCAVIRSNTVYIFLIYPWKCVVGIHYKSLLISTHNNCFCRAIKMFYLDILTDYFSSIICCGNSLTVPHCHKYVLGEIRKTFIIYNHILWQSLETLRQVPTICFTEKWKNIYLDIPLIWSNMISIQVFDSRILAKWYTVQT